MIKILCLLNTFHYNNTVKKINGFCYSVHSIKVKVIKDWIQGISRDKIGQNNGIGAGTVTSIIQQAKTNIADIDLMRALALNIKKEKLDINYFSSAVRLKKVLDRAGTIRRKGGSIS